MTARPGRRFWGRGGDPTSSRRSLPATSLTSRCRLLGCPRLFGSTHTAAWQDVDARQNREQKHSME